MAMTRLNSLFHWPRPMRVVLQKFFVVVGLRDERLPSAQSFNDHLRRVTEIGDEPETARSGVKDKSKRIDGVMRYWECLHGNVANGELGAGPKNPPVSMLSEQSVTSNRLRSQRVAINRHIKFATENFHSTDVIRML